MVLNDLSADTFDIDNVKMLIIVSILGNAVLESSMTNLQRGMAYLMLQHFDSWK
jgi:hypothetical protein